MAKKTLLITIRDFFFQGVGFSEIKAQVAKLTEQDKHDLVEEFAKIGIEVEAPGSNAPASI